MCRYLISDWTKGYCSSESVVLCNEPGSHKSAVANAGHSQPLWIRYAALNQTVDSRQMVGRFCAAKITLYSSYVIPASAAAPARIGVKDRVASLQERQVGHS